MNRRRVLAAAGTALSASLAGCAGLGGSTPTIDHPDASVEWATPLDDRPNAIVADADRLYAGTHWDVHGIDRAGGGIDWTLLVAAGVGGTGDGQLLALDAESGSNRWQSPTGPPSPNTAPAVDDERVYLAGSDDRLHAHALDTGEEVWRATLTPGCADCWRTSDPVVVDDTVCAAGREALVAFDAETGEEKWRLPLDGGFAAGPVVVEGTVYVAGERAYAVAV